MRSLKIASSTGQSVLLDNTTMRKFLSDIQGAALLPMTPGYDAARKVWNGMIDRYPALIVQCTNPEDVIRVVDFTRGNNLLVSVRSGGHNIAGHAVNEGGLVIDLSRMKGISIDRDRGVAFTQAGLTWGEFDRQTQAFGLATTGGLVSTTGIAGLTLGGGLGWLMRQYGLACDNLLSVEVVTADGSMVKASPTKNQDLFWGLCGGGGNFGVATAFEYRLHPVGTILGGAMLFPINMAKDLLFFYREYLTNIPNTLSTLLVFLTVPQNPLIPSHLHGVFVAGAAICHAGPPQEGEKLVKALRTFGRPLVDFLMPLPYSLLQSLFDDTVPAGQFYYGKSCYFNDLTDSAISTIVEQAVNMTSPQSQIHLQHLHGKVREIGGTQTAFPHRDARYAMNILAAWSGPKDAERHKKWTRDFWQDLQAFSTGGVYVNFLADEGEEQVKAAYGCNYDRLVSLKNKYDPTNFFRLNQNIKPNLH